jgi:hypothetical protein
MAWDDIAKAPPVPAVFHFNELRATVDRQLDKKIAPPTPTVPPIEFD